jgi:hypothetical protein
MMTEAGENFLADTVDKIEASYEFMLAYAAQGRDFENTDGGGGPSIRAFLEDLEYGLEKVVYALAEKLESLDLDVGAVNVLEEFKDVLADDAGRALKAVRVVQSVPSISSQLVDNLNASVHLRCLLTDIFVIDEALKAHQ